MFWQNKKIENIDIVFPYMSLSKQKKNVSNVIHLGIQG